MNAAVDDALVVNKGSRLSPIWLIPLVAVFVGGWFVYQQWQDRGVEVTLYFDTVAGLIAGKTKIKTKDVDVGVVTDIRLPEEREGVALTLDIEQEVAHLLKRDSQFWVVKPCITIQGVLGLNTLLSGA